MTIAGSRSETRSRAAGMSRLIPARPFGMTSPYSVNRPRRPLIWAVRNFTQLLAHAMQRQDCLLFLALDRDRLDAWLLHHGPDRPRVVRIALVAAHEGPDHLRRQKPDLVTEFPDPAGPMLRAAAGLHRDQARHAIGEMFQKLRPHQPQVDDLARLHIDPMQLKHPLRRIHADDRSVSLHLGPSGLPVKSSLFPLGTLMPSAREGPPQPSRLSANIREWEASIPFLLWLAHDRACEAELAQQLDELLAADRLPISSCWSSASSRTSTTCRWSRSISRADSYDALFAAQELAA